MKYILILLLISSAGNLFSQEKLNIEFSLGGNYANYFGKNVENIFVNDNDCVRIIV